MLIDLEDLLLFVYRNGANAVTDGEHHCWGLVGRKLENVMNNLALSDSIKAQTNESTTSTDPDEPTDSKKPSQMTLAEIRQYCQQRECESCKFADESSWCRFKSTFMTQYPGDWRLEWLDSRTLEGETKKG